MTTLHPICSAPSQNSEFLQELYSHPNWKEESDQRKTSATESSSFEIRATQQDPLCFSLRVKEATGKVIMAPFWAEVSNKRWCFQNGNPHSYPHLNQMLEQLLLHARRGDTLLPNASLLK